MRCLTRALHCLDLNPLQELNDSKKDGDFKPFHASRSKSILIQCQMVGSLA